MFCRGNFSSDEIYCIYHIPFFSHSICMTIFPTITHVRNNSGMQWRLRILVGLCHRLGNSSRLWNQVLSSGELLGSTPVRSGGRNAVVGGRGKNRAVIQLSSSPWAIRSIMVSQNCPKSGQMAVFIKSWMWATLGRNMDFDEAALSSGGCHLNPFPNNIDLVKQA